MRVGAMMIWVDGFGCGIWSRSRSGLRGWVVSGVGIV